MFPVGRTECSAKLSLVLWFGSISAAAHEQLEFVIRSAAGVILWQVNQCQQTVTWAISEIESHAAHFPQ
jgi:hypothetical protein